MKAIRVSLLLASLIFTGAAPGHATRTGAAAGQPQAQQEREAQQARPSATLALTVDREITAIESKIIEGAEAMPEDKYDFSPASLNIKGGAYLGARTFATQVKHIAASNYFIWSPLTGDKLPEGLNDGNGPRDVKTKAEIIRFLKESFALGHRAANALTPENMLQQPGRSRSSRLSLAMFGVTHAYDHYGQIVEYLRMNGIVPATKRE